MTSLSDIDEIYLFRSLPIPHRKCDSLRTITLAPSGTPSDVQVVYRNDTSIKLTWSRPDDSLTDYEYPFDYTLCIKQSKVTTSPTCVHVQRALQHTFTRLTAMTNYSIDIRAQSWKKSGDVYNLSTATLEAGKIGYGHNLPSFSAT